MTILLGFLYLDNMVVSFSVRVIHFKERTATKHHNMHTTTHYVFHQGL